MAEPAKLKRNLSFFSMISLACGAVIGGWLTESPYWFELTGSSCAFVFPFLALLLIPVGLSFAELTTMLPFASAVDVWTTNALGHGLGWAIQWLMFLVQVVEPPMMAYIFITVLELFMDLNTVQTILVACLIVFAWFIVANFSVGITGKLSNIFFVVMMVFSISVCLYFLFSGNWHVSNLTAGSENGTMFAEGAGGFAMAMAVLSLKFIGFELTPTLIEETNFPRKKMWVVILTALIIPALLYGFVVLALGGVATRAELMQMSIPEISIINMYSMPKILIFLALTAGLLHALTTLMAFFSSSARSALRRGRAPSAAPGVHEAQQVWAAHGVQCGGAPVLPVLLCLLQPEHRWLGQLHLFHLLRGGRRSLFYLLLGCPDPPQEAPRMGAPLPLSLQKLDVLCRDGAVPLDHHRLLHLLG